MSKTKIRDNRGRGSAAAAQLAAAEQTRLDTMAAVAEVYEMQLAAEARQLDMMEAMAQVYEATLEGGETDG